MLQGDAKICCFLDVIDGVFVEFVCVWLPLVLPLPSEAQAFTFFWMEFHLPLLLPLFKAVYVLL